ncbi:hypothetical protein F8S09_02910 [Deinococcus sp. SDU3-2]|uniref:Uncharacterized protein n=1 Tax=Deinococcus terrestris TaxID=2651870 RepID=A0A7X1NUG0_9DEIO|nr:hypothetical protein [Deinococcus terrestris]MPY65646.1 hypothetical protein [Deinococcus terrestris]
MFKRSPLLLLSLPLLLAACGGTQKAPQNPGGELVSLQIGLGSASTSAGLISTQGLPTGGFVPASAFVKVKVRSEGGDLVTFNKGVYAPKGDGDQFLTLNVTNNFGQTVLLPKGKYTFESIVKDGQSDQATQGTLLAYGPARLTDVNAQSGSVRLTVHAVMNPAAAALRFAMPTDVLYTGDVSSLRLQVPTHTVGGKSFAVPTTDYSVGAYVASRGSIIERTASKLGVSFAATGSAEDPSVRVSVPVTGWVQTGPERAEQTTSPVEFMHTVSANAVTLDTEAPLASITTQKVAAGTVVTVSGTASDPGGRLTEARLYDGTTLVASSAVNEQGNGVAALTFEPGTDRWQAGWQSPASGSARLTLVVNDDAGNETSAEQEITVEGGATGGTMPLTPVADPAALRYVMTPGETKVFVFDVPEGTNPSFAQMMIVDSRDWTDSRACRPDPMEPGMGGGERLIKVTITDALTGEPVTPTIDSPCMTGLSYTRTAWGYIGSLDALKDLKFTVTNLSGASLEINPNFDVGN